MLDVVGCGSGKVDQRRALVCHQITIGVLGKDQLTVAQGNQGSPFDNGKAARVDDLVEERGCLIHAAVTIGVFQHLNSADGIVFAGAVSIHHVGLKFTHPETSLEIKLGKHGVLDHRRGSDQLNTEAGRDLEALGGFFGGKERSRMGRPFTPVDGIKQVLVFFFFIAALSRRGERHE